MNPNLVASRPPPSSGRVLTSEQVADARQRIEADGLAATAEHYEIAVAELFDQLGLERRPAGTPRKSYNRVHHVHHARGAR